MHVNESRARLRHVRWIGGGSGAGKSMVAERLASEHDLHLYATDDVMTDHARRCLPADCPSLAAFAAMSMDERWVSRSPEAMLETFPWFHGEGFHLILADLLQLPPDRGVLVEGFRLLPGLVQPLLVDLGRAVWLLPTPNFRRTAFERRGATWSIAGHTSEPPTALANLLERDRLFTERLEAETREYGLAALHVHTTVDVEDLARRTATALGLPERDRSGGAG